MGRLVASEALDVFSSDVMDARVPWLLQRMFLLATHVLVSHPVARGWYDVLNFSPLLQVGLPLVHVCGG